MACSWEESTVVNVVIRNTKSDSGGSKAAGAAAPSVGRISSRQGAKAAFDDGTGCRKCFCVTFDET